MTFTKFSQIIWIVICSCATSNCLAQEQETNQEMMVRIAEVEIYPEHLQEYTKILTEEAAASIKIEVGVIAIFPMSVQKQSHQIRIVEIYANKEAYQSHLATPHFQHYKTATKIMVKSLKLVEMEALDKPTMLQIFTKLQ